MYHWLTEKEKAFLALPQAKQGFSPREFRNATGAPRRRLGKLIGFGVLKYVLAGEAG